MAAVRGAAAAAGIAMAAPLRPVFTLRCCSCTLRLGFHSSPTSLQQVRAVEGTPSKRFAMSGTTQQTTANEQVDEEKMWQQIHDHQKAAAKLSHVEEARTLLENKRSAFISTISQKYEGFPFGSMVEFASDPDGRPLLAISSLSPHTRDLELNPKCSLLVPKDPSDKSDTIITIIGEASFLSNEDWTDARAIYLKKHPNAFWVDFGDFKLAKIEPKNVRFVTGLVTGQAAVADLDGDVFKTAAVDPIAQFSTPIASHMNKDHSEDTQAIVEHVLRIKVDSAMMVDLDRLGFNVKAVIKGTPVKLRVPFPRPAQDRKDVKTLIVDMLNAARATV